MIAAAGNAPSAHQDKASERGNPAAGVERDRAAHADADFSHFMPLHLRDRAGAGRERDRVERALDGKDAGFRLLRAQAQGHQFADPQRFGVQPENPGGEHMRIRRRIVRRGADLAALDKQLIRQGEGDAPAGLDRTQRRRAFRRGGPCFDRLDHRVFSPRMEFDAVAHRDAPGLHQARHDAPRIEAIDVLHGEPQGSADDGRRRAKPFERLQQHRSLIPGEMFAGLDQSVAELGRYGDKVRRWNAELAEEFAEFGADAAHRTPSGHN